MIFFQKKSFKNDIKLLIVSLERTANRLQFEFMKCNTFSVHFKLILLFFVDQVEVLTTSHALRVHVAVVHFFRFEAVIAFTGE